MPTVVTLYLDERLVSSRFVSPLTREGPQIQFQWAQVGKGIFWAPPESRDRWFGPFPDVLEAEKSVRSRDGKLP